MIKKKPTIENFKSKNIEFTLDNQLYKVLTYYHTKMSLDVILVDDKDNEGIRNIAFAHIPKSLKKIIKPN